MTLQLTDTIVAPSRGSVAEAMAYAKKQGAKRQDFLLDYFTELYRLSNVNGFDASILVSQSANETDSWRSPIWQQYGNPAGLAVTNSQNLSVIYQNGMDAARAHVVHMWAYRYGKVPKGSELEKYIDLDGHYKEVFTTNDAYGTPLAASVKTIGDFNRNGRWALLDRANTPAGKLDDYGNRIVQNGRAMWPNLPNQTDPLVTTDGTTEEPVATPQTIDFSSLPFPVRIVFIPIAQTNQRPGLAMEPKSTTYHDTGNPSVNARCQSHVNWMADGCRDAQGNITQTSWHMTVDDKEAVQHLPFNEIAWHAGDGYNGPGNRTSIAIEECVNSDRDVAKTRRNAQLLHAHLRKELGLSETKPHKAWSGKNCPENLRNAGLWDETAKAIDSLVTTTPKPPANPVYAAAHPVAAGSRIINTHQFLAPGGKTFQFDTIPAEWADGVNVPTGPTIKKGTKITQAQISHYVQGTDGNLYLVLTGIDGVADGSRVPASAVIA